MTIFAGYAAQAMANATSYRQLLAQSDELERRADSQRRLLEINERLLSTLDQAGVLEMIADGLRDVVAYDNLSVYRTDHQRRVMHPVLAREQHAEEVNRYLIPFGQGLMGWAVEHVQPILANDALGDPRALQIPGTPTEAEAVVVVPLQADGEVLGALNVSRVGGSEVYFSDNDFELVQLFAAQASIALRNADTHHAVSQLADTDALTGLGNHGAFQRDLGQRVDAGQAAADPAAHGFSVLMMDLDRFKAYNDRNGHPAGDALLHRIATTIYGAARSDDRVYRYGGDEFVLVLPGATAEQAATVGGRVRRAVAALTAEEASPVTITVGVAAYPTDATTRSALIAAADSALYYGKRAGTDRVVRYDELIPEVGDLRGTLEQLAADALRDADEEHPVELLVERATRSAAAPAHASVRDALLTTLRSVESSDLALRGHADRVGRLTQEIAARVGIGSDEARCIELAARLQGLDEQGVAELAPVSSMANVADLIGGHRKLVADGSRRRRSAARPRGSVGSHIIGVASAYDELVVGIGRDRVGRADAIAQLRRHPATYRRDVLDALAAVVEQRPDIGRRRRRNDAIDREARGAA
jgi:diguanylate cyclase (GGDEF)-like protein